MVFWSYSFVQVQKLDRKTCHLEPFNFFKLELFKAPKFLDQNFKSSEQQVAKKSNLSELST